MFAKLPAQSNKTTSFKNNHVKKIRPIHAIAADVSIVSAISKEIWGFRWCR